MSPPRDKSAASLELAVSAPNVPTPGELPPAGELALEAVTVTLARGELFALRALCNEEYRTWNELADRERARLSAEPPEDESARAGHAALIRACMDRGDEALELGAKLERVAPATLVREALERLEKQFEEHHVRGLELIVTVRENMRTAGLIS